MKSAGKKFRRVCVYALALWIFLGCAFACESSGSSRQAGFAATLRVTETLTPSIVPGAGAPTITATGSITPHFLDAFGHAGNFDSYLLGDADTHEFANAYADGYGNRNTDFALDDSVTQNDRSSVARELDNVPC